MRDKAKRRHAKNSGKKKKKNCTANQMIRGSGRHRRQDRTFALKLQSASLNTEILPNIIGQQDKIRVDRKLLSIISVINNDRIHSRRLFLVASSSRTMLVGGANLFRSLRILQHHLPFSRSVKTFNVGQWSASGTKNLAGKSCHIGWMSAWMSV